MELTFKPVVRNITNDQLYFYEGENIFQNIASGKSGKVTDEAARKTFRINLEMTEMINEFPIIADLIKSLNLKFDGVSSMSGQK